MSYTRSPYMFQKMMIWRSVCTDACWWWVAVSRSSWLSSGCKISTLFHVSFFCMYIYFMLRVSENDDTKKRMYSCVLGGGRRSHVPHGSVSHVHKISTLIHVSLMYIHVMLHVSENYDMKKRMYSCVLMVGGSLTFPMAQFWLQNLHIVSWVILLHVYLFYVTCFRKWWYEKAHVQLRAGSGRRSHVPHGSVLAAVPHMDTDAWFFPSSARDTGHYYQSKGISCLWIMGYQECKLANIYMFLLPDV